MKFLGWRPEDIQASLSVKRDAVLFSMLYLFNCFTFSKYTELAQVATKPWLPLVWLYGLATLVPLFWRNKAPATVFITQLILTVIAWPFLPHYSPVVGIPIALYSMAVHRGKSVSFPALIISLIPNGFVAFQAGVSAGPQRQLAVSASSFVFLVLAATGAYVAGHLTRASRQHIEELERDQAAAREAQEAEERRQAAAREAEEREQAAAREAEEREQAAAREAEILAAERRKIARELHDSISHAVTVIVLLAAGAARVADTSPTQAKQSLVDIEAKAKEAMAELRQLLAVLGRGSTNQAASANESGSRHGLAGVTVLLDSVRATGMPVSVHLNGTPRVLAQNIDLTAYRIVQEGLTNVMKHGGEDAKPQLRLVWKIDRLVIQIDNGTGLAQVANLPAIITGGWGLRGLSERIHAVGGELTAEPHNEAGFRLTAVLPVIAPATSHDVPSAVASHAWASGSES